MSHADKLSPQVVAGKRAFEKYNCNDCHIERVLGMGYMVAQSYMRLWMGVTFFLGICFFIGLLIMATDLLTLRPAKART